MDNPKFGNKNEAGLYQVGKDIAKLEAKVELLEKVGGGGVDVLKVIVPAATNEDFEKSSLCVVQLPKDFQNSLLLMELNGSWIYITSENMLGVSLSSIEIEIFIIKLTDFKNVKDTVHAEIKKNYGNNRPSDA